MYGKEQSITKREAYRSNLIKQRCLCMAVRMQVRLQSWIGSNRGQGTTEYAILVGVLVVIAILAITIFRPKIQELWDAIASGINSL